jgi:hypothetical protein
VRPGTRCLRRRHVTAGSFSLLMLMVASACAGANAATASEKPDTLIQSKSVMRCHVNAVVGPLDELVQSRSSSTTHVGPIVSNLRHRSRVGEYATAGDVVA